MASLKLTSNEILGRARGALDAAEHGHIEMVESHHATRQIAGLKAMVTFGRQVTFVLQKLKTPEPRFEEWWKPIASQLDSDPLMRYFKILRNTIEKQGLPNPIRAVLLICNEKEVVKTENVSVDDGVNFTQIEGLDRDLNPTKAAINIAAVNGGTYMKLAHIRLPDPPTTCFGKTLESDEMEHLGVIYLDCLGIVWQAARDEFGKPSHSGT